MRRRAPRTGTSRTSVIAFRVSSEQRREIEDAAIAAGATVSAFVASTVARALDGRRRSLPVPSVNPPAPVNARPVAVRPTSPPANATPRPDIAQLLLVRAQAVPATPPPPARPQPRTAPAHHVPATDPAPHPELHRIGNEINRIAHAMNARMSPGTSAVALALRALLELLTDTRDRASTCAVNPADPAALYELRRIANNVSQIANATHSGLTPGLRHAIDAFRYVLEAPSDAQEFRRRLADLAPEIRKPLYGPPNS